jgi:hypothetical protein
MPLRRHSEQYEDSRYFLGVENADRNGDNLGP